MRVRVSDASRACESVGDVVQWHNTRYIPQFVMMICSLTFCFSDLFLVVRGRSVHMMALCWVLYL